MDPLSAAALGALVAKVLDATAEQAGAQLWQSLCGLVRRVCRRESRGAIDAVDAALTSGARPRAEDVEALAAALAADAQRDHDAHAALRAWVGDATATLDRGGDVRNVVHGDVHGTVIQARDIHGDITFNG